MVKRGFGRSLVLWLHRWLGLLSGVVVLVLGLSGAAYSFRDQLFALLHREASHLAVGVPKVGFASAIGQAAKAIDWTQEPIYLLIPAGAQQNLRMERFVEADTPGWSRMSEIASFDAYYFHRANGRQLAKIDLKRDPLTLAFGLHTSLLLHYDWGHIVTGTATTVFLAMMLLGLALWWPKRRAHLRQRLLLPLHAKRKRMNWGLHTVLGFYSLAFGLVFGVSGLVIAFGWADSAYSTALGLGEGKPSQEFSAPEVEATPSRELATKIKTSSGLQKLESTLQTLMAQHPTATDFDLWLPTKGDAITPIEFGITEPGILLRHKQLHYLHPTTFAQLKIEKSQSRTLGWQVRNANYDIHTGLSLGVLGQVLACLASLVVASLPITGFIIYRGRGQHKKVPNQPKPVLNS